MEIDIPDISDRFEVRDRLGRGGMATVYRARDRRRDETVALKILHRHLREDEVVIDRLRREVELVERLEHPNVVETFELLEGEVVGLVLEFVPGRGLDELLAVEGALSVSRTVELADQILAGLEAAHAEGIVHRDVKPHNVLVAAEAKLADFGLARLDEVASETAQATATGTAEYMAPEQFADLSVDARADLYAAGVTIFEMLTGELPFRDSDPARLEALHREGDRGEVLEQLSGVPLRIRRVVKRAIAPAPEARFQTADEMRRALRGEARVALTSGTEDLPSEPCPECGAELVFGVERCLECGARNERLVRRPGEGTFSVLIPSQSRPSRYDTKRDWSAALRGVIRELGYADLAERTVVPLGDPPTLFASGLTEADAGRVAQRLSELSVRARVVPPGPRGWYHLSGPYVRAIGAALFATFAGVGYFMQFMIGDGTFGLGWMELGIAAVTSLVAASAWIYLYARRMLDPAIDYSPLSGALGHSDAVSVPEAIAEAYRRVGSGRLRRLWRRFLGRAAHIASVDLEGEEAERRDRQLEIVLREAAFVAEQVVAAEDRRPGGKLDHLRRQIDQLDAAIEASSEPQEIEALIDRKTDLSERIAEIDAVRVELDRLTSRLLELAGSLRELESRYVEERSAEVALDIGSEASKLDGAVDRVEAEVAAEEAVDREVSA